MIAEQTPGIPIIPRRQLPSDPFYLIRHARWSLRAGQALIAVAAARMAIELHVQNMARGRVGLRCVHLRVLAAKLRDIGVLTAEEVKCVWDLNFHLSSVMHTGTAKADPSAMVEAVAGFMDATKDRATMP